MTELPPSAFTWEKYCGKVGVSVTEIFKGLYTSHEELRSNVHVVGWCKADKIRIRQRDEGYVILVVLRGEDWSEECWCHVLDLPVEK